MRQGQGSGCGIASLDDRNVSLLVPFGRAGSSGGIAEAPMTKLNIETLKTNVLAAKAAQSAEHSLRSAVQAEKTRIALECRPAGIAALLTVARLADRIEGFPDRVSLESPNGHNRGLSLSREVDGFWRIEGDADALHHASLYGFGSVSASSVVNHALKAMDIEHSSSAHSQLLDIAKWPEAGKIKALSAAAATVPGHVFSGILVHGSEMAHFFGADNTFEFAVKAVRAIKAIGVDLDAPCHKGALPPVACIARRNDAAFLSAMLSEGADPDAEAGGYTAAMAAVEAGQAEAIRLLHRADADLRTRNEEGNTLLHLAVLRLEQKHADDVPVVVSLLLDCGLDSQESNFAGWTPENMIEGAMYRREENDGEISGREEEAGRSLAVRVREILNRDILRPARH